MKRLLTFLKDYRREAVLAPALKMLEAFFDLFVPLVTADIINRGIGNGDTGYIMSHVMILILLGLLGLAASITAQYFAAKAAVGVSTAMRHTLFDHIQSFGFSDLDKAGTGTLITRMTSDINQVQNGVNLFLRLFLRSPFIVFGAMIMAFTISVKAALIFVVAIPVLAVIVFGIMKVTRPLYRGVQGNLDALTGAVRENLTGIRVVRAFGREEAETARFHKENARLTRSQLHVGNISALMNPLTFAVVNVALIVLLNTGAFEINVGGLAQGDVIALVNYLNQILVELVKLANLIVQVTRALASADRVDEILRTEPVMQYGTRDFAKADPNAPAVLFDHVHLTYPGGGGESLTDISFTAMPGETIGVIGGTGSGKSSLVNLIPRFYDRTDGTIRLFGIRVENLKKEAIDETVSIALQKAALFSGTIRSNLLMGKKDATEEDMWRALTAAQGADFVRGKKDGLDAGVEQGGRNFSGGQRQRLTVARALIAEPKILILDDSASALDYATDAALRRAIREMSGKMTVFIVSQRANSVMQADRIIVLDEGRAVGMGTHEELLRTCEVYRDIYESQFGKGAAAR